jgi:hypothetical protein
MTPPSEPREPRVLEWVERQDKRTLWTAKAGLWTYTPYPTGGGWLRHGPSAVKFCDSADAAKALAQALQRVLDGEPREPETWVHEAYWWAHELGGEDGYDLALLLEAHFPGVSLKGTQ